MSSFALRMIAIVTMLIDHAAYVFYRDLPYEVYLSMRLIGRLAMPLFCFLIAEGLFHTRNKRAYLLRMLLFALVSEIPFDLAFSGKTADWESQNVFFTLFLGLLCITLVDFFAADRIWKPWVSQGLALLSILACAGTAMLLKTDYNAFGVFFIFAFYLGRGRMRLLAPAFSLGVLALAAYIYLSYGDMDFALLVLAALGALVLIWRYNGQRGGPKDKVLEDGRHVRTPLGALVQGGFYLFYPVHLLLLWSLAAQ